MTLKQELASWNPFNSASGVEVSSVPRSGTKAPSVGELQFPPSDGKPAIVAFLRHCGCPFAEKTFLQLRELAASNPSVSFVAISHSDEQATKGWLDAIGGKGKVEVIVDTERKTYGAWGLGASSFWHVLSPWALAGALNVGKEEGIWNKPTQSGSRWQTAGSFAVSKDGVVVWGSASKQADDVLNLEEGMEALKE